MIEAITETHKSTGEGIVSSQTMFSQEVQELLKHRRRKPENQERWSSTSSSPSSWQEERRHWNDFRHRLRTWLSVVDPKVPQGLDVVEKEPSKKLSVIDCTKDCTKEGEAFSKHLYGILSSYTKNQHQLVLKAITQQNGLEGYCRILEFHAPATKARSLQFQRQIMNYRFSKEAGYSENILKFEELLEEFERASQEKV